MTTVLHNSDSSWSFKLLLAFASIVISDFSLLKIHDQDFFSLLDKHVFRKETSSSTRKRPVYGGATFVYTAVSARVYLPCHNVKVTGHSVHLFSLHYTKQVPVPDVQRFPVNVGLCSRIRNCSETAVSQLNGRRAESGQV
jgi:hypothetical protein